MSTITLSPSLSLSQERIWFVLSSDSVCGTKFFDSVRLLKCQRNITKIGKISPTKKSRKTSAMLMFRLVQSPPPIYITMTKLITALKKYVHIKVQKTNFREQYDFIVCLLNRSLTTLKNKLVKIPRETAIIAFKIMLQMKEYLCCLIG